MNPVASHRCGGAPAIAFDLDGTLFDSEPFGHRVAFNRAFVELGMRVHWDLDTYGRLLAIAGGRRRVERHLIEGGWLPDAAVEASALAHRRKTELFLDLASTGHIPPRPGVVRLLHELREGGVDLHVVTTGSASWVHSLLTATFGSETFGLVITGDDVLEPKPSPEAYHQLARRAGVEPSHLVVVEDSTNGLAAARAADLTCVMVTNPYTGTGPFPGAAMVRPGFEGLDADTILQLTPCQSWRAIRSV